MTDILLGIDGGGTKTTALLADREGRVLGRSVSGPSNYNAVGFEAACTAIETAIAGARQCQPGELAALCLGLAGAGRQEDREKFLAWAVGHFPKTKILVVSDAEILLAAGSLSGAALALICGTGSIVYGRTASGELFRAGGWGYLFGDEGSGFAIGVAALKAVMRAYDGRGEATLLTDLVLGRRRLDNPQGLIHNIYGAESPRGEIADLADLVEHAAGQKDSTALTILETAAQELAEILQAVYRKLGNTPIPLAISGGVILNDPLFAANFRQACQRLGLEFTTVNPIPEPAEGAVRLARALVSG